MELKQEPRLTSLLPNDLLHRVERLRINPNRRLTSRMRGEHLSGRGGSSTEFADYRDYASGDDLRFVDWNIFSRLRRPYLKLYHLEEEMNVVCLIDASASMGFEDKLGRAKQLAAAFGVMGLHGAERVSVYAFNEPGKEPRSLPPSLGRQSMRRLFAFCESIVGGGDAPLERGIESVLKVHRGRGVLIVLSDFLTFGDLRKAFSFVTNAGLEIFALQILGPSELDPEVSGDLRLIDCETNHTLDITSGGSLLQIYHEYRQAYMRHVETMSQQRGGRYASISSADPLEWVIMDLLRRRGWVR